MSSSTARSTPSVARSSRSASLLVSRTNSSAPTSSSVRPGRLALRCTAAAAWTLIREMLCPSTSCSSRAIRSRSSVADCRARTSRSRSAASTRCSVSCRYAALTRMACPNTITLTNQPLISAMAMLLTSRWPLSFAITNSP